MKNFSTITDAVVEQLKNWLNVNGSASNYRVKNSVYVNHNPDLTPWIGVYRGPVTYTPHTIGKSLSNWQGTLKLRILVQAYSAKSGAEAEERSEAYVNEVLDGLLSDYQLGGTVETLDNITVDYAYLETDSETLFYHQAEITVDLVVRSGT